MIRFAVLSLVLVLAGCPESEPGSRDSSPPTPDASTCDRGRGDLPASQDAAPRRDAPSPQDGSSGHEASLPPGTAVATGSAGGMPVPSPLAAFWAAVPDPPQLHLLGPAAAISSQAWDSPTFLDNQLSITVVMTDIPDACASWAGFWTAIADNLLDFMAGDRAAAAAKLDAAEQALLPASFWMVGAAVSADSFAALPASYQLGESSMLEVFHQRLHTPWLAAAQGAEIDNVDSWSTSTGTLTIEAARPGHLIEGHATTALADGAALGVSFKASHCPAFEAALASTPFFE